MVKIMLVGIFISLYSSMCIAQTDSIDQIDSFDVFTYQIPEFFTKSELSSRVQLNMTNEDGSFCLITMYKSQPAKADILKDITSQWNEQVVKRLTKADKKPQKILTEQMWEGWSSTLGIGNFYHKKKKAVIILNSFRNNKTTACVVFAFTDKIFKGPVETFSKNLHLLKPE